MAADRVIRWSTAGAVLGVAAVAAVASHEHASDLVLPSKTVALCRTGRELPVSMQNAIRHPIGGLVLQTADGRLGT